MERYVRRIAGFSSSPRSPRESRRWSIRARSTSVGPSLRPSPTKFPCPDRCTVRPSHGPPRTFTTVRLCVGRYFCGSVAVPTTLRRYFQHVWPIEECGAEDGRAVGHMLHDLVSSKPKDLDHAICEFVDRTAMLRDCGFAHIGDMLVRLLRGDVHGKPGDGTVAISPAPVPPTAVGLDPSALTEEHAVAIGSAIVVSVHDASAPVAGLKTVVKSHAILEVMKSQYAWFVPMLEVLMAPNVASDADAADEESGFSSVVRLGGESALMTPPPSPSPPMLSVYRPAVG